jgi:hypothetical protein
MPRKPTDTTHISLRIRESLRRDLAREAEKHRTSLNTMIRLKLEDAFGAQDRRTHGEYNRDMEVLLARYSKHLTHLELAWDLAQALEKTADPDLAKALAKTTDPEITKLRLAISAVKKTRDVS